MNKLNLYVTIYDGCDAGNIGTLWDVQKECQEVLASNFSEESMRRLGAAIKGSECDSYPLEYGLVLEIGVTATYSRCVNLGTIDYDGTLDVFGVIKSGTDVFEGVGNAIPISR